MLKNSMWQNQSKGDYKSSILGHKGDKLAIYIPIILMDPHQLQVPRSPAETQNTYKHLEQGNSTRD